MSYQVLARKWRPHGFAELVGQEHVVQALSNALDQDRLHHAYLFTGTRGVGKTTLARIFAKSLNCEEGVGSTPCGKCSSCVEVDEGRFVDLLEVDAASRTKVEQTRELLENVPYAPVKGRYKVYLIDEVHMFSDSSFNALLKTLEEPPPHVKFLLATTDPQKLPMTVLSRCLQFGLKRLTLDQIGGQLRHILDVEEVVHDAQAITMLASGADGSMRDGLSLLDQAISFGNGEVLEAHVSAMLGTVSRDYVFALLEALVARDGAMLMHKIDTLAERSPDFHSVLDELLRMLHRAAVLQAVPDLRVENEVDHERYAWMVETIPADEIQLYYQIGITGKRDMSMAPDLRSGFEMVMLRMLAFQPQSPGETVAVTTAQKKSVESVATLAVKTKPGVAPTRQQATAPDPQPAPVTEQKRPQPQPTTNSGTNERQGAEGDSGAKEPSQVAAAASHSMPLPQSIDWNQLQSQLDLGGISGQLAMNCAFDAVEDNRVKMTLPQEHQALMSTMAMSRMQAAMREHFSNADLVVEIELGEPQVDTPAQRKQRDENVRLAEAKADMVNDPFVKELQSKLDARVIDETIKPV